MTLEYVRFMKQLPLFREKFLYGAVRRWAWQWKLHEPARSGQTFVYWPTPCRTCGHSKRCGHIRPALTDEDLRWHFERKHVTTHTGLRGSLAVGGKFQNDKTRWLCVDADDIYHVRYLLKHYIPTLEKLGIEYIWEESGVDGDRAHVWIFCDASFALLCAFTESLRRKAKMDQDTLDEHGLKFEFFPTSLPENTIRMPGGLHCKQDKPIIYPVTYKDETSDDPHFVIESIIKCAQLTESDLLGHIDIPENKSRSVIVSEEAKKQIARKARTTKKFSGKVEAGRFYYESRRLKLDEFDDLPEPIRKMSRQCQAINTLLRRTRDGFLEETGIDVHRWGLHFWNMLRYAHIRNGVGEDEVDDLIADLFEEHRFREFGDHQWDWSTTATGYVPRCSTMRKDFNLCKGCPFVDRPDLVNPMKFITNKPYQRTILKRYQPVTIDQVRKDTFGNFRRALFESVNKVKPGRFALTSFLGAGKSTYLDRLVASLAQAGYSVLVSVHSIKVALEHSKRLQRNGQHPIILASHKSIFETELNPGFDCPYGEEISELIDLRTSSANIRSQFCDSCKFKKRCPYPEQYAEAIRPENRIVIAQHAHLRVETVMRSLTRRQFDVSIIDENFTRAIVTRVKSTSSERNILRAAKKVPWAKDLAFWLQYGGLPGESISVTVEQMRELRRLFKKAKKKWNVPDYLQYHNEGYPLDSEVGILKFTPPPESIPITAVADATGSEPLLQLYLNDDNINFFGYEEFVNPKSFNPKNEIIQVLDGSTSKTWLEQNPDRFDDILNYIGVAATEEWEEKKILVTTYISYEQVIRDFFNVFYPEAAKRIIVNHMERGTNDYRNFDVQVLLAGVHYNGFDYLEAAFIHKYVRDYWRKRTGKRPIGGMYQNLSKSENPSIEVKRAPIEVLELQADNSVALVQYEGIYRFRPVLHWHRMEHDLILSETTQAVRVGLTDCKPKTIILVSNDGLKMVCTKVIMLADLIGRHTKQRIKEATLRDLVRESEYIH